MAYNQYGTFNPAALEPYPIETELAKQATGGSAQLAGILGDQYWIERQANKNLYGQELDAQHEQARQQIAAQMADARYKALSELGKTPGGWELAAGSPELSQIFGGSTSLPAVLDIQRRAQAATNLEHAGSGAKSLVEGGFQPNIGDLQNVTQTNLQQVTPLSTINAQIAADAKLRAAAMNANKPAMAAPMTYAVMTPNGRLTVPLDPTKDVEQQTKAYDAWGRSLFANRGQENAGTTSPATPPPPASTAPPVVSQKKPMGAGQVSGAPPVGRTGLQPNTQQQTASADPAPLPTDTPEGKQAQVHAQSAIAALKSSNNPLYDVIRPQGTPVVTLYKDQKGVYTRGRDRQKYYLQ